GVSPVYNVYARVSKDPSFAGLAGDYEALLRPLFMLSFLVDDYLAENDFFCAHAVMLTSASRKAAVGLAPRLPSRRKRIRVIALTSPRNFAFVASLGCYHEVVAYDGVTSLPAANSVVLVDMAGDSGLRARLHHHFGEQMKHSAQIGLTHRKSDADEPILPGAQTKWFFAPDQIRKRAKEWGPGGVDARFSTAWTALAQPLRRVPMG